MALRTTNQERYATVQTYGGTPLAAGPITRAAFDAYVAAGQVVPVGESGGFGRRDRGAIVEVASDAVADTVLTVVVWAVVRLDGADHSAVDSYELRRVGSLAATVGTCVGASDSDLVPATVRKADTMVWTVGAYGTFVKTLLGGQIVVHNPADNTPAQLGLGDVGNCLGLIFEATSNPGAGKTVWVLPEVMT